uniref:(Fe-S)-binding protein n=1 Tax=Candidatus Scatousia sp. TaxID=3085663 RepID=UPI00402735BE
MELSGLQIFKYLPAAKKAENSNCKKCGCPTCMAFALKLAKKQVEISSCPYAPEDLKEIYLQ